MKPQAHVPLWCFPYFFFFLSKLFAFKHFFFLETEVPKEISWKVFIYIEMRMNCLNIGDTLA